MNEIIALKKEVKKLKQDIFWMTVGVIILVSTFVLVLSKIDPVFDSKTQKSYEILKGLYLDMRGNKNDDVKGIVIENLDWRTVG